MQVHETLGNFLCDGISAVILTNFHIILVFVCTSFLLIILKMSYS